MKAGYIIPKMMLEWNAEGRKRNQGIGKRGWMNGWIK
jgi:hypothetical protein